GPRVAVRRRDGAREVRGPPPGLRPRAQVPRQPLSGGRVRPPARGPDRAEVRPRGPGPDVALEAALPRLQRGGARRGADGEPRGAAVLVAGAAEDPADEASGGAGARRAAGQPAGRVPGVGGPRRGAAGGRRPDDGG